MDSICYVIGAGEHFENDIFTPDEKDLVIAADGGYEFLQKNNIRTDIVVGDFDSLDNKIKLTESDTEIIKLNPIKDETDMLYAINIGIEKGYNKFHIYGGTGGRTDHTIANIQTLTMVAKKGLKGFLYTKNEVITAIHNSRITFDNSRQGHISVFSLDSECHGVNESGLKYTLDDYDMNNTYPIGVSNEFIGTESSISVKKGTLLIIYSR